MTAPMEELVNAKSQIEELQRGLAQLSGLISQAIIEQRDRDDRMIQLGRSQSKPSGFVQEVTLNVDREASHPEVPDPDLHDDPPSRPA